MRPKHIAIWFLTGLFALLGTSCYTHIKFSKKGYSALSWNNTHKRNRYWRANSPESWKWDYYYAYPGWLDKKWYWKYCRNNQTKKHSQETVERKNPDDEINVLKTCCLILSWLNENSDDTEEETSSYDNQNDSPCIGS